MNVFKEAAKAETKLKHWGRKRDELIERASDSYNRSVRELLLQVGKEVTAALVAQGLVHKGMAEHAFAFQNVIEADAGAGPSELDRFAQAACGGPAAQALADAAMAAPDLVPRAQ